MWKEQYNIFIIYDVSHLSKSQRYKFSGEARRIEKNFQNTKWINTKTFFSSIIGKTNRDKYIFDHVNNTIKRTIKFMNDMKKLNIEPKIGLTPTCFCHPCDELHKSISQFVGFTFDIKMNIDLDNPNKFEHTSETFYIHKLYKQLIQDASALKNKLDNTGNDFIYSTEELLDPNSLKEVEKSIQNIHNGNLGITKISQLKINQIIQILEDYCIIFQELVFFVSMMKNYQSNYFALHGENDLNTSIIVVGHNYHTEYISIVDKKKKN